MSFIYLVFRTGVFLCSSFIWCFSKVLFLNQNLTELQTSLVFSNMPESQHSSLVFVLHVRPCCEVVTHAIYFLCVDAERSAADVSVRKTYFSLFESFGEVRGLMHVLVRLMLLNRLLGLICNKQGC